MINRNLVLYSPISVFTSIWFVTIALYVLNPFQLDPIRTYTWFVILLGLSMVYLGFITSKLLGEGFTLSFEREPIDDYPFDIVKIKKYIIIFTTISLIGKVAADYLIFKEIGNIELYLVNPRFVREFIKETQIGNTSVNLLLYKLFNYMGSLLPITIILAGAIVNIKKNRLVSIYPLSVALFQSVATLQRVYFIKQYVIWIISSFLIIYYYPSKLQKEAVRSFVKRIIWFIIFSVTFLFVVVFIRSLFNPLANLEKLYNSFYFYIAGNIYWLDIYLSFDKAALMGASIFRSFIKFFVLFGLVEPGSYLAPNYEFYRLYDTMGNTYTYLRVPYEDFKLLGVMFISYLWGMLGYFAMRVYLNRFSFIRFGFAGLVILSFFWSFYGFNLIHITAWIWKLLLLAIFNYLLLKNSNNSAEKA